MAVVMEEWCPSAAGDTSCRGPVAVDGRSAQVSAAARRRRAGTFVYPRSLTMALLPT